MEINNKRCLLNSELLTKEDLELLNKIRKIKISNSVFNFYKTKIRANKNETKKTATKKLIRNIILANSGGIDINKLHKHTFYYGNLSILVNFRTKKIIWLNNNNKNKFLKIDKKKKKYLCKILNIHKSKNKGGKSNGGCINKKRQQQKNKN